MEKALIFSDLHVHDYKQHNEGGRRLKNGIAFLNYMFQLAHKNSIRYILMPGDLFNNMTQVATKAMNAIIICFQENLMIYPELQIIAVSGNHDQATKSLIDDWGESALGSLASIFPRNFFLLDDYENDVLETDNGNCIRGIPYLEHPEHFRKALTVVSEGTQARTGKTLLLMHQMVASGFADKDDIQPDDSLFAKFHMVLNGHIHTNEQVTDKFINVGSPMHRDRDDMGKTKGFWVVDLDDPVNTISFKDITTKFPQFIHKTVGEELTDWEKEQYVIWIPQTIQDDVKDAQLAKNFNTSLAPAVIMENYCNEVLPESEREEKLSYGVSLL
jgi:DNA repair exonuclease SbcCD nuclease subunit